MAAPALRRSFTAFHLVLGLGLLFLSSETLVDGLTSTHGLQPHLVLVGGLETLGAALFLFPRTLRVGGALLLLTILLALFVHALSGQWRVDLVIYAAGTWFVMVHGAAWGPGRSSAAAA